MLKCVVVIGDSKSVPDVVFHETMCLGMKAKVVISCTMMPTCYVATSLNHKVKAVLSIQEQVQYWVLGEVDRLCFDNKLHGLANGTLAFAASSLVRGECMSFFCSG